MTESLVNSFIFRILIRQNYICYERPIIAKTR